MLIQLVRSVICLAFCFAFSSSASSGGFGYTGTIPVIPTMTYDQLVNDGVCKKIENPKDAVESPLGIIKIKINPSPDFTYCKTKTFCTMAHSAKTAYGFSMAGDLFCDRVDNAYLIDAITKRYSDIEIEARQKEAALMKLIIEKDAALSELEKKVNELEMQNK